MNVSTNIPTTDDPTAIPIVMATFLKKWQYRNNTDNDSNNTNDKINLSLTLHDITWQRHRYNNENKAVLEPRVSPDFAITWFLTHSDLLRSHVALPKSHANTLKYVHIVTKKT